jgi:ATP-dependent DNA helicase RecG
LPDPEFVETSGAFVVILRKSKLTQEFLQGLGLNERQAKAVDHAKTKGSVTNADYVRLTGISRNWATKELKELVEKGVFERVGKGKGSHYKLRGA